jgi:sulfur-oxidizing protein SoxZ
MSKGILRVKARVKGDATNVKIMAKHAMETGNRKDSKGNKIPAKYIQNLAIDLNGRRVMDAYLGPAISKNPYLAFTFEGGTKGDELQMTWTENTGDSATEMALIK